MALLAEVPFITHLPATYNEHERVISEALREGKWVDLGTLAQERDTRRRPLAHYRACESEVVLYGQQYRAIVYHSSAHDVRRQKRLDRQLIKERQAVEQRCQQLAKQIFFCEPDARSAAQSLQPGQFHRVQIRIVERSFYGRSRPRLEGPRTPVRTRYLVETEISTNQHAVALLRQEEGCFVLLAHKLEP